MENFSHHSDLKLVALLKEGNKQAMAEIYERYWGPMLSHAYRMLHDEAAAKDVLQEVFLTLWRRAPTLRQDTALPAYLHTLVRNRVLNELAKTKVRDDHLASITHYIDSKSNPADEIYIEKE